MSNKHLIALAAAALLAGCGGGDTSAPSVTPAAATAALRAKALSVSATAVSTAEAARQLMDFAENSQFASYFPGHPTTQSLPPFLYRYYPSTGIYLGVAAGNDPNFPDGVYVMGGVFGPNATRVGALTDYITPVDTSGGSSTGANNGCYDPALMDTAGTRMIVDMQYTGELTGAQHIDSTVGNVTSFEGNSQARELSTKTTGTGTSSGETVTFDLDLKSYQRRSGDAELTEYGTVLVTGMLQGISGSLSTKIVWNPPVVNKQYGLAIGQTYSLSRTGNSTATMSFGGQVLSNTVTNLSYTETVKYVRRESMTVPAGTYSTCVFETRTSNAGGVSTSWVIVGKGIPVKAVNTNASGVVTQTGEATSITLNGQRL